MKLNSPGWYDTLIPDIFCAKGGKPRMSQQPSRDPNRRNSVMRAFSISSQIGFTIASCLLIGVLIGRLLDNLLGTSPWLTLVFSLLGAAASFKSLYDMNMKK